MFLSEDMKSLRGLRRAAALLPSLVLLMSCVDHDYDLKGGISTDVSIPGNVVSLPLGSLTPFTLRSLLEQSGQEFATEDGVYGISVEDSLQPFVLDIPPVNFHVDPIGTDLEVNVADVELKEFTIPAFSKEIELGLGELSLDEVEQSLPVLDKTFTLQTTDVDFAGLVASVVLLGQDSREIPALHTTLQLSDEEVPLNFSSPLPDGLKRIRTLWPGEPGEDGTEVGGMSLALDIHHPAKFSDMSKSIDAEIVFPPEFELSLDDALPQRECYTLARGDNGNSNILRISSLKANNAVTHIQMLVASIGGLESFCSETGEQKTIDYSGSIRITISYTLDGSLTVLSTDKADDYAVSLTMNKRMAIADALVEMDDFVNESEPQQMEFGIALDDVTYVDSIGTASFVAERSHIVLKTFTDKPLDVFEMDPAHPVIVKMPEEFELDLVSPKQQEGVAWDATAGTLTLSELTSAVGGEFVFAVRSVKINRSVRDGVLDWRSAITISAPDNRWTLKGKTALLSEVTPCLGERTLFVSADESRLEVSDVSLATAALSEPFSTIVPLDIDVPLPSGFVRQLHAVWPAEDMELTFALDVAGFGLTDVPVTVSATIDYPDFICIESDDPELTVRDGSLILRTSVDLHQSHIRKSLRVTHFDFTSSLGDGLEPVREGDESWLKLSDSFLIEGTLLVDRAEWSLADLQDEFSVHAEIGLGDVTLSLFEGILDCPFEPVEMLLPFADNVSGLSFDEGGSLLLSETQLFASLTNPFGVPVLADIRLEGVDATGGTIEGSAVEIKDVLIRAADYDAGSRQLTLAESKYLFTNNKDATASGFTTVWVESLPRLLRDVPHSVRLVLTPRFDSSVKHYVDISTPLEVKGAYKVSVPMRFEAVSVKYEGPEEGVAVSLDGLSDVLSRASVRLEMDARNTIPLELTLTLVPYDAQGNILSDVRSVPLRLPAGDGSAVGVQAPVQKASVTLTADERSLRSLSYLKVRAEASADHTEGGIALSPEQGVLLTNLVLHVEADVDTTF